MNERKTFTTGRRLSIAFNVLLSSILAPAVGGLIIYLCFRPEFRRRLDLTPRATYTLSERTQKVLEGLKTEVHVYTCFVPTVINSSGAYVPGLDLVIETIAQHTNDLVREYELKSRGKLQAHLYDHRSTGHTARIEELSKILGKKANNVVYVTDGKRSRTLELDKFDLADFDPGSSLNENPRRPKLYAYKDEEAITGAILSITQEKPPVVGVLSGHGELRPESRDRDEAGRPGVGGLLNALHVQNFELRPVDLSQQSFLENAPDILAVLSPVKPLTDSETTQIVQFVQNGGRMFLALDPDSANTLDMPLLDQCFGLERVPHPVCQETKGGEWQRRANVFECFTYNREAEVVEPLARLNLATQWRTACSFRAIKDRGNSQVVLKPMLWTTNEAWIDLAQEEDEHNDSFDPSFEKKGAAVLGYQVELPNGAMAVVLGDSDLLSNQYLNLGAPGNRDLAINSFEYLARREQLISIAPQPYDELRVDLTPAEQHTLWLYVVIAVPAIAFVLAIAVFWNRRR